MIGWYFTAAISLKAEMTEKAIKILLKKLQRILSYVEGSLKQILLSFQSILLLDLFLIKGKRFSAIGVVERVYRFPLSSSSLIIASLRVDQTTDQPLTRCKSKVTYIFKIR